MTTFRLANLIALILAAASGCATTAHLTIAATPPIDNTSPRDCQPGFRSLMIVPPRDSPRGWLDKLTRLDALFLNSNLQLISPAITGRAVGTEKANLSDVERALILARDSNAEALLQVVRLDDDQDERIFVAYGDELRAADKVEPTRAGVELTERKYRFVARVIDVQSGSIVLLVDVSQNTTEADETQWSMELRPNEIARVKTTEADRRNTTVEQILDVVAKRLQPRADGVELSEQPCLRRE